MAGEQKARQDGMKYNKTRLKTDRQTDGYTDRRTDGLHTFSSHPAQSSYALKMSDPLPV